MKNSFERQIQTSILQPGTASPAPTPEVLPTAQTQGSATPFGSGATVDTTAQTLAGPNPTPSVAVIAAEEAAELPTGPYPSMGAAQAAASPANAVMLNYADWVAATTQSYTWGNPLEIAAATTQACYQQYLADWKIMQVMRHQPGVAAELDALLVSMAAAPQV